MSSFQQEIPPTGRITITLDWAEDLNAPPRCGAELVSAAWSLPTGITQNAALVEGTKAQLTITTIGLKANSRQVLTCAATLSNGDIIPAAVECIAVARKVRRSAEVCPAPGV